MTRRDHLSRAVLALAIGATLVGAGIIAPAVRAQTPPDRSEVVLVLDFSASILRDNANRNRFGAALERIAARVDETSADHAAGDATVTIVRFATKATAYPDCADLRLLGDLQAVARFADCLRSVATAYRKGVDPAVTRSIGTDTNYVAAMEQAAAHVPSDAKRPTLILFTDGKHDVRGCRSARCRSHSSACSGTRRRSPCSRSGWAWTRRSAMPSRPDSPACRSSGTCRRASAGRRSTGHRSSRNGG